MAYKQDINQIINNLKENSFKHITIMKKILIIEDQKEDFDKVRDLLKNSYDILPNEFDEMSACIEYPQVIGKSITDFVIQQIDRNYKDLGIILCDIKLGKDWRGGNVVIRAIRNHRILDAPEWTSLVPIIAMTHYADRQESVLDSGADFSLIKEGDANLFSALVKTNIDSFERRLKFVSSEKVNQDKSKVDSKKVFVVHGHENALKQEVARTLEHLKLIPIILHEQANEGRTLIEKFEAHGSDVGFAVILLTDDDLGRLKTKGEEDNKPRARQNVVFEMGYFMGLLSRSHVVVLCQDNVERPSDIGGILYIPYNNGWKLELVKELKACGYNVSADNLP